MTDKKKNAGNPFTGLPLEILIGEVLRAATEASEQVKRSGTEYPDLADPGKGDPEKSKTAVLMEELVLAVFFIFHSNVEIIRKIYQSFQY